MPAEVKNRYLSTSLKFHSWVFGLICLTSIFQFTSGYSKSIGLMVYMILVTVIGIAFNFVFLYFVDNLSDKWLSMMTHLRFWSMISLFCLGSMIGDMSYQVGILLLLENLLLLNEEIHLSDLFDSYSLWVKLGCGTVLLSAGILFAIRRELSFELLFYYGAITLFFFFAFSFLLANTYIDTVRFYDRKTNELYFQNIDLYKMNEKLMEYQEKVKAVNSEINYQRMSLEQANASLERMNLETESLIEMMKSFAESFDVESNVAIMMNTIMKVKKPGMVGMYIDSNVYANEVPYMDIISVNSNNQEALSKCMWQILLLMKQRKSTEPVVICEDGKFFRDYLKDTNIKNAVAFPAYENEHFYGVLLVASTKYTFFENGYGFYETMMMDFTTALRSNRLYIQLKDTAVKDGLTKVYNRAYFNEIFSGMCEDARKRHRNFSVMLMDIDKFKSINDTYGHIAGDEVIKMVAKTDWDYAKKYKGVAVRYGGEEFLLIMFDKTVDEMKEILQEMQNDIKNQVVSFRGQDIHVNVSMGVASYPATRENPEDVLDAADNAMYYSKEHGRGLIVIDGREMES